MSAKFLVGVMTIIVRDGHVLLMRRSQNRDAGPGLWETGAGRVEYGESPQEAAKREALEETGLQIEIVKLMDTFSFKRLDEEAVGLIFWCRAAEDTFTLSDEHDQGAWVPFADVHTYNLSPALSKAIQSIAETAAGKTT